MPQGGGRRAGDLPLRLVLVDGLDQLRVLLVSLLGALAGRAEQQRLQVAEQVLPGRLGDLPVGDGGLQAAGERGDRRGDRRQRAGLTGGGRPGCVAGAGPGVVPSVVSSSRT